MDVYTSLGTLTFYGLLDSHDHELSVLPGRELIHVQKDKGQNTLYRNVDPDG